MRQLRDYEKKLRAKHSQPNIHRVGDPLIRGQPMPDLVYGSEESEDNPDGENETSEIKPRPKPRIPKFKPTEVRLCCAGVNFINILRVPFSHEKFLSSFSLFTVWLCNFLAQEYRCKSCS